MRIQLEEAAEETAEKKWKKKQDKKVELLSVRVTQLICVRLWCKLIAQTGGADKQRATAYCLLLTATATATATVTKKKGIFAQAACNSQADSGTYFVLCFFVYPEKTGYVNLVTGDLRKSIRYMYIYKFLFRVNS